MMQRPRDRAAISSGSTRQGFGRHRPRTREGRASLEALIAGADVLLQNLKPGSMDKLGFSRERLRKDYPS